MNPQVKFVQAKTTTLQAPITSTEVLLIPLQRLEDIYGNALTMADFGDIMYIVHDPGTDSEEIVSATDFTVNDDGSVAIDTGIVRGLSATSPYTTGGTAQSHSAGSTVIISNNPQLYNSLVSKTGNQTIDGIKVFSSNPQSTTDPVNPNDLARLSYIQSLVLGVLTTIDVIVPGTAGQTIAVGQGVYFDTGTNRWKLWDADTAATVNEVLLGIAQGAGTSGNPITSGILLQGVDTHQTGLTPGSVYYASNTTGGISITPGTVTVTVGIAKSATELYFDPRFNQQLTQNQLDALAGTSGTAPSGSNKFVDAADVSNAGVSGKIVRLNGTALPAADGSALTGITAGQVLRAYTAGMTLSAGKPVIVLPYSTTNPTLDTSSNTGTGTGTALSSTFTVGVNSNRALILALVTAGSTATSITYNGVGMTKIDSSAITGSTSFLEIWYLNAPATGANTLTINFSGSRTAFWNTYSYYNVSQSGQPEVHLAGIGGSGASSASATPLTNGALVFGANYTGGGTSGGSVYTNNLLTNSVLTTLQSGDSGQVFPMVSKTLSVSGGSGNVASSVISIAPVATSLTPRVYLASAAQASTVASFLGLAQGSSTIGNSVTVAEAGVDTNQSGLTIGSQYYLGDTPGTFSASAGTSSRKAGIAIDTDKLLITNIW